jgi:hypothetical protein
MNLLEVLIKYRDVLTDRQHSHRGDGAMASTFYLTITPLERDTNTFQSA